MTLGITAFNINIIFISFYQSYVDNFRVFSCFFFKVENNIPLYLISFIWIPFSLFQDCFILFYFVNIYNIIHKMDQVRYESVTNFLIQ